MLKNQNIFITGATGFIGRHLALELAKDNNVVALVRGPRSDGKDKELASAGIKIVWGDLLDSKSYAEKISRADYVFHFAALFKIDGKKEELYQANVLGTKTLLEACKNTEMKRFICCSTAYVLAGRNERDNIIEDEPYAECPRNWYEWSKAEMEKVALSYYRDYKLPIVIIRPTIVYGPGSIYAWFATFNIFAHKRGRLISGGRNRIHFISVHDVVSATIHLAEYKGAIGQIYNICDEHPYTQKEALTMMCKSMGVGLPRLSMPKKIFRASLRIPFITKYLLGLSWEVADFYIDSFTFSNAKLKNTAFIYRYPDFKDGLEETVRWYRQTGILPIQEPIRLRRLIDPGRWSMSVVIIFCIAKTLQWLRRLGAHPKDDGWRKCTQAYLQTEQSKFVLVAMRLNFGSPDILIKELAEFLRQYPITHYQLEWSRFATRRRPKKAIDIVRAEFNEDGTLQSIIPYLDTQVAESNIDEKLKTEIAQAIIAAYNETHNLPDKKRPLVLKKKIDAWLRKFPAATQKHAVDYVERILSSTFIRFEDMPPADENHARFDPPPFIRYKHPGWGVFNITCRIDRNASEADLWAQCHHVAVDGVPMQEVLKEFEKKWGKGEVKLPPLANRKAPKPQICSSTEKNGVYYVNQIVDFRPLIKVAQELERKYSGQVRITPLRLFVWGLGQHPNFKDIKFILPIDLLAYGNHERTLGLGVIRPATYFDDNKPQKGFIEFCRKFERQVRLTRQRRSETYEMLESYALLPPLLWHITRIMLLEGAREGAGSVGVSTISQADLFMAPYTDIYQGFIAVSNFFKATEDGQEACHINVKGPKDKVLFYLEAIKDVAEKRKGL